MPAIAVIAGGFLQAGSAIGETQAGKAAAEQQGNIARAKESQFERLFKIQQDQRFKATKQAENDPRSLAAIDRQLQLQETAIGRAEDLQKREKDILDSTDPALIEVGEQALRLLKGEEAKALAPIRRQREEGRRLAMEGLRRRGIDPTSSAGIETLTKYDAQTDNVLAGAQQATLGQFLQVTQQTRQLATGSTSQAFGTAGTIGAQAGTLANQRRANIIRAQTGFGIPFKSALGVAGGENIEALSRAQVQGQLFKNIGKAGGQLTQAGLSGAGGGGGAQTGAALGAETRNAGVA